MMVVMIMNSRDAKDHVLYGFVGLCGLRHRVGICNVRVVGSMYTIRMKGFLSS